MKFCVFTDLHYDVIPDGDRRVRELLEHCLAQHVEFIVELGDLCHPTRENRKLMNQFQESGLQCYFSMGNHSTDFCSQQEVLDFLGLKKANYTVIRNLVKFIFLHAQETPEGPLLPENQLQWLERELESEHYFVICTHQSLCNDFITAKGKARGILNKEDVRILLERCNHRKKRVLLCINGHEHGSDLKFIGGIPYYTLNAASYFWQNIREIYPYSSDIHKRYPYLKNMVLYQEPLHSIITIGQGGCITIQGMEGHYKTVGPMEIGMEPVWNGVSVLPRTLSLRR